jgi:hypothetical protein
MRMLFSDRKLAASGHCNEAGRIQSRIAYRLLAGEDNQARGTCKICVRKSRELIKGLQSGVLLWSDAPLYHDFNSVPFLFFFYFFYFSATSFACS